MLRRLFQQVYLTIVVSLILVVLAAGAVWRFAAEHPQVRQAFELAGDMAAAALPPAEAPIAAQQWALDRIHERHGVDLALFNARLRPMAAAGRPLPSPPRHHLRSGWLRGGHGPTWLLHLPDGRWLVVRMGINRLAHPAVGLAGFLAVIALVIAAGAYPVVRRLTRRLERLQKGVESLGAGELTARVKVEGRDEVARLAESFNRAAARIEELVGAHKLLLANASHELRTPLSRIRLGVELLKDKADPERKAALERDIAELDRLIDGILLSSRLDALTAPDVREEVDLLAMAAEEGAHFEDCTADGEPVLVMGDPQLLRRMIRNLVENAARHGLPPVEVTVTRKGGHAVLAVTDSGEGVPESDRERVFTPFQRLPSCEGDGGAGLGLALVRQIARRHGGEAVIQPDAQHRSRFVVRLPLA